MLEVRHDQRVRKGGGSMSNHSKTAGKRAKCNTCGNEWVVSDRDEIRESPFVGDDGEPIRIAICPKPNCGGDAKILS